MKKKVKLTVIDRLVIPELLPRQGRIIEMQITQSIIDYVRFTPQEISDFEIKDSEKGTQWNISKAKEIEVELTKEQSDLILRGIAKKDADEEATREMLGTIDKLLKCLN